MRGANLTPAHQRQAAQACTHMQDFADHNKRIGADSAARQRVLLRARKGSRLLIASDVHQLWLADIKVLFVSIHFAFRAINFRVPE